jgi:glycosyltransferase involved in cell wall biosynthesis
VRLRVCFVVDSGTDVRLADGLAERASLRILARRIPGGREISQAGTQPLRVEVGPKDHILFAWFVIRRLLALRHETDVVIVQGYGPTAAFTNLAGRVMRRSVLMLVCSPAEAYYRCRQRSGSRRPFRRLEYSAIRFFSAVNRRIGRGYIVLSSYLATVVRGGGTTKPIDVIPVYGVDREIFHPSSEDKRGIRRRLRLPEEVPIVFFSSRVAPEKDAVTLLQAVRILVAAGRPVNLLHLSGGHRELVDLAASIGVGEQVIAGDAVAPFAALADYYRASDVCVQSSVEEGLGFSPLEALACGVPVVATAVGGLNDTIRHGETGWQVPIGDAEAMADAIRDVLDDPAEGARRAARGAQLVDRAYERRLVFASLMNRLGSAAAAQGVAEC